jgi:hypothetical protein
MRKRGPSEPEVVEVEDVVVPPPEAFESPPPQLRAKGRTSRAKRA